MSERAWLVEWRFNGVQWLYLWPSAPGGFSFTADPNSALRFARRQDAEACLAWAREVDRRRGAGVAGGELLVTEHEWSVLTLPQEAQDVTDAQINDVIRSQQFWRIAAQESGFSFGPELHDFARAVLALSASPQAPAPKLARSLTDELMDCVDRLGSEARDVDPRVWDHLRVYMPPAAQAEQEPVAHQGRWEGAEEWMPLAWQLCADECGEEACNELVWEGGPVPEPWGDRWLKYEDEARRLIALVRQHVPAASPQRAVEPPDPEFLTAQDKADLLRIEECFSDNEGYDLPRERMQRLSELGVIRHNGGGVYSITAFGMYCTGAWPALPLKTAAESNAEAARLHAERMERGITKEQPKA